MKNLFIPPVLVFAGFLLIVLFYLLIPQLNLVPFPYNLSGLAISFAGFVIMGKARDLFRKHNTTLDIKTSSFMITEGVFSKTRNPMYAGMFLLLMGAGIGFMNLVSILVSFDFALIMEMVFIPREEKLMEEAFGRDYLEYKKTVRRWI